MRPRKIEYFEDQLKVSPAGREVLEIVYKHNKEVMYLINKNRPTMVAWQRNHGPKFVRSFVDSGFEDDSNFLKDIDGLSLEIALLNIGEVLQDNGTPELKAAIGEHANKILHIAREANSLKDVIQIINNSTNL